MALDDGGLRGAQPRYPGDADDVGTIRLALHAMFIDEAANVDVEITPLLGRRIRRTSMATGSRISRDASGSKPSPRRWAISTHGWRPAGTPASRSSPRRIPPRSSIHIAARVMRHGRGATSLLTTSARPAPVSHSLASRRPRPLRQESVPVGLSWRPCRSRMTSQGPCYSTPPARRRPSRRVRAATRHGRDRRRAGSPRAKLARSL